jgi:hypothetical protein
MKTSRLLVLLAILGGFFAMRAAAETSTICMGDIPPDGMVITAATTSSICGGSCRTLILEPLHGSVMLICANQPIPARYTLQSVTTSPSCACLGGEDNSYVIRLNSDVEP